MFKYGLITVFCLVFLVSCSPTEAQIQAAIDQTQAALPTSTHTPEPTATIEPTPTPNFPHISNLYYQDVLNIYEDLGLSCENIDVNTNDNYDQECGTVIDGAIISGNIFGNSSETVSGYFLMVVPMTGYDQSDYIDEVFQTIVNYGDDYQEKQNWIVDNLPSVLTSSQQTETQKEFQDVLIVLKGGIGLGAIFVLSN